MGIKSEDRALAFMFLLFFWAFLLLVRTCSIFRTAFGLLLLANIMVMVIEIVGDKDKSEENRKC